MEWDEHAVKHRKGIIPECAPWAFNLAEHVVGVWDGVIHTDNQTTTH
jgi:hypothetical protein